jgi:hypothetical protein
LVLTASDFKSQPREVIDLLGLRVFEETLQCEIISISLPNLMDCLHSEQHITATANDDVTTGSEEATIQSTILIDPAESSPFGDKITSLIDDLHSEHNRKISRSIYK